MGRDSSNKKWLGPQRVFELWFTTPDEFGPLVSLRVLGWPPPRRRDPLLPTSQPSKLRIQGRDCFGGGLDMWNGPLDGLERSVQLGLSAGSLVAPVGSSAACPNTAQFLGGLVEGGRGGRSSCLQTHHSSLQSRPLASRKCLDSADSIDLSGKAMARTGLRMMPTFPLPPLKFRTAGFPRYGFKAGLSDEAFPADWFAIVLRTLYCHRASLLKWSDPSASHSGTPPDRRSSETAVPPWPCIGGDHRRSQL